MSSASLFGKKRLREFVDMMPFQENSSISQVCDERECQSTGIVVTDPNAFLIYFEC